MQLESSSSCSARVVRAPFNALLLLYFMITLSGFLVLSHFESLIFQFNGRFGSYFVLIRATSERVLS